jgi:hypothetical protein
MNRRNPEVRRKGNQKSRRLGPRLETVRAGQHVFVAKTLHRRPGSGDRSERTNVFAAQAVAEEKVEREHL